VAKFRQNHRNQDSKNNRSRGSSFSGKGNVLRLVIGLIFVFIVLYILSNVTGDTWNNNEPSASDFPETIISNEKYEPAKKSYYPESTTGEVIEHKHYTLSYSEEHEQAEWVTYKLTKENLKKQRVKRAKKFNPDKAVSTTSAYHKDYSHSGYTRGHMAPAGDMAFSKEAMRESFYMSNMSPQVKECNGGIWRELEETVRDWAYRNEELYIVSGPILTEGHIITKIGRNQVSVPDQFYKIIVDVKGSDKKAIAFLIPNEKSERKLDEYIVSIDELESTLGINFFADFLEPELEEKLESSKSSKGWKFDNKRYKTRINKWNNY